MARLSPFRQYDSHVYSPDAGAATLHPQIEFCITAFVATTISGLMLTLPPLANAHYRHGGERTATGAGLSR
ncbi:hypothetical protein KCP77_22900 [Salmonella enterica subsp. enterica]|nr:hypothetical protein KCP77_22900 [Salmonella enterica subsp. enterica]